MNEATKSVTLQVRMDASSSTRRKLTPGEILKRNPMEQIKAEKPLWRLDARLTRCRQGASPPLPSEEVIRLRWHGIHQDTSQAGHYMLRVKVPNAVLSPAQVRTLGEVAIRYGQNRVDLTTRQGIQLHGVRLGAMAKINLVLDSVGLGAKGSGGDVLRSIACCPVAGLSAEELCEASPLVLDATRRIAENPIYFNLPHLHRWSISACPHHCCAPEVQDAALVATRQDGKVGFAVWVGGSLAVPPRLAKPLGVFVQPAEALDVMQSLLDVWRADWQYRVNRARARFKFMVEDYGPAKLRAVVENQLGRRLTDLKENPKPIGRTSHLGIHRQQQPGRHYLGFGVLAGQMTGDQMLALADIVATAGQDLRLTREQNVIVTGVPEALVETVADRMQHEAKLSLKAHPLHGHGVACCGLPYCKHALTDCRQMLVEVVKHLEQHLDGATKDLHVHLSGCAHACGQHWVGDIGIQGTTLAKPLGKGPAYDLVLGGGLGAEAQIGQTVLHRVPAPHVKLFVERLLRAYQGNRRTGETIQGFFRRHSDSTLAAIARGDSPTRRNQQA